MARDQEPVRDEELAAAKRRLDELCGQVGEDLVPLLEAGLSPLQSLDDWATEDTDETHGVFTQAEWSETRGVGRPAIGANAGNAPESIDSE